MTRESTLISRLIRMHTYKRPMGSDTEKEFRAEFVAGLPGATEDRHGNWHVRVGANPKALFSCHTDTVHSKDGRQKVYLDAQQFLLLHKSLQPRRWNKLDKPVWQFDEPKSNCLGADDTVGVFLCREMVLAGVEGHYVFHWGEERGCVGSSKIANQDQDFLKQFAVAIAFDRRGYGDVITHQRSSRCASEAFALSLAAQLNFWGPEGRKFDYKPCWGIYTDTAEYADIIPECTNLSVGYSREHSSEEFVYVPHVLALLEAMCKVDIGALTVARDPVKEKAEKEAERAKWASKWSAPRAGTWTRWYPSGVYGKGGYFLGGQWYAEGSKLWSPPPTWSAQVATPVELVNTPSQGQFYLNPKDPKTCPCVKCNQTKIMGQRCPHCNYSVFDANMNTGTEDNPTGVVDVNARTFEPQDSVDDEDLRLAEAEAFVRHLEENGLSEEEALAVLDDDQVPTVKVGGFEVRDLRAEDYLDPEYAEIQVILKQELEGKKVH